MKLGNLKTTLAVSVFGLSALLGASEINAQSRQQNGNLPPVYNQRQDDNRVQNERNRDSYGRDDHNWERNTRYKVYQNGRMIVLNERELETLKKAVVKGYEEGFKKGQFESRNRKRGGYGSGGYRNDDYGYGKDSQNNGYYGSQNDGYYGNRNNGNYGTVDSRLMNFYFQKGFEKGYQEGFNTRKGRGWGRDERGWENQSKGLSERELREILRYERF